MKLTIEYMDGKIEEYMGIDRAVSLQREMDAPILVVVRSDYTGFNVMLSSVRKWWTETEVK